MGDPQVGGSGPQLGSNRVSHQDSCFESGAVGEVHILYCSAL